MGMTMKAATKACRNVLRKAEQQMGNKSYKGEEENYEIFPKKEKMDGLGHYADLPVHQYHAK